MASVSVPAPSTTRNKNIVICCDGTGNQFGPANSNVVKLYTTLLINNDQQAYYHPGVGTMGDPRARTWITQTWSVLTGLAFAAGFAANVQDAYCYLMENYNEGDRVFLFGFSRGAYTVRALAGLLHGYGLLCRGNEGHLPYAWRMFAKQVNQNKRLNAHSIVPAEAFKQTFSHTTFEIHFVGIWDTVSSVGWVYTPLRLLDMARNPLLRTGRHAISIDERRCFYHDNLWGDPYPGQDLAQVWFPGVHSDIGGSYRQCQADPANSTLQWMLEESKSAGLLTDPEREQLVFGGATDPPQPAAPLYKRPEPWQRLHHSLKLVWWPLEFLPHRFCDKDDGKQHWRVPLGARRKLPHGALVHSTAVARMAGVPGCPAYHPRNLRREWLHPLDTQPSDTTANLAGCYRYCPPPPRLVNPTGRLLTLLARWLLILLFIWADPHAFALLVRAVVIVAERFWKYALAPAMWWLWHYAAALVHWFHHLDAGRIWNVLFHCWC